MSCTHYVCSFIIIFQPALQPGHIYCHKRPGHPLGSDPNAQSNLKLTNTALEYKP